MDYSINLLSLGHNFETTNTRKPIKGSGEVDFRLVWFKRKKKALLLRVGAQGPMTSYKKLNLPQLWRHPQKTQIQNFPSF